MYCVIDPVLLTANEDSPLDAAVGHVLLELEGLRLIPAGPTAIHWGEFPQPSPQEGPRDCLVHSADS